MTVAGSTISADSVSSNCIHPCCVPQVDISPRTRSTSRGSCRSRADRLTASGCSKSAWCHRCRSRNAASSTQCVSGVIRPALSASSTKTAGRDHALLRMLPAHQRLCPAEPACCHVDLGLAVQRELVGIDRPPQIADQTEAALALVIVHAAVEREMAMRAGAVHRDFRAAHQLVGIVTMVRDKARCRRHPARRPAMPASSTGR